MGVEVIVLNGGSSSGKSSLVACLQDHLDGTWLALGVDDLIRELSHGPFDTSAGGTFAVTPEGSVIVGDAFRAAELAWYEGLAAVARAGTRLIIDEVFLGGGRPRRGALGSARPVRGLGGRALRCGSGRSSRTAARGPQYRHGA